MTKQTTVRLPDELADAAEAVARVKGTSVNALIVESLAAEVERVRRDKELLDRLAGDPIPEPGGIRLARRAGVPEAARGSGCPRAE